MESEEEDDFVPIYEQDSDSEQDEVMGQRSDSSPGSSSNSEYNPETDPTAAHEGDSAESEGDSAHLEGGAAEVRPVDDEAAYLTGGETDLDGGADSDSGSDLFDGEFNPMEALSLMDSGNTRPLQPYTVLSERRKAATRPPPRKASGGRGSVGGTLHGSLGGKQSAAQQAVFGAGSEDIAMMLEPKRIGGRRRRKSGKKPGGQPRRLMTQEAEAILGAASMLYASGKNDEALAQLMEVVRLSPNAAEAYHTIGTIYETKGNPRRALDFYMIAAHLPPRDLDLWRRLASMSTEQGFVRQAIYCLNKVVHVDKDDVHALWDRAVLFTELGHHKRAVAAFERIQSLRPGDAEVAKALPRLYFRMQEVSKALALLQDFIRDHPQVTDLTHINILAELQMSAGQFGAAASTISAAATNLCRDAPLPLDLQVKAGECALKQGKVEAAQAAFQFLMAEDPAEYADLHLLVANLWLDCGLPERAQPFLQAIHGSGSAYDDATVWALLATSYEDAGNIDAAISLYSDVIEGLEDGSMVFMEATLALANLLCKAGQADRASSLLLRVDGLPAEGEGGSSGAPEDLGLMMRRAELLLKLGQEGAFLETMLPAVDATVRHYQHAESHTEGLAPALRKALRRRERRQAMGRQHGGAPAAPTGDVEEGSVFQGIAGHRDRRKLHIQQVDAEAEAFAAETFADREGDAAVGGLVMKGILQDEQQIQMAISAGRALVNCGHATQALQFCEQIMDLFVRRWMDKSKRDSVQMVAAAAHLQLGDLPKALTCLKAAGSRWPHSNIVWNAMARVITGLGAIGHMSKFVRTQRSKFPTSVQLMLLMGHICASQGHHSEALSQYLHAYLAAPRQPLLLLCIGVTFLNMAMSRKIGDRHQCVLRGFAFIREYSVVCGRPQESKYNMARAAHQLGLLHLAVPLYEAALKETDILEGHLRWEAAHNLALIFTKSGAHNLARSVLREHCVI